MLDTKRVLFLLTLLLVAALALSACNSGSSQAETEASAAEEHGDDEHNDDDDEHAEDDEHSEDSHAPDDHMAGAHDVPEDAAAVPNPIEVSESSITAGAATFAASCAVCHGEDGKRTGGASRGGPADYG